MTNKKPGPKKGVLERMFPFLSRRSQPEQVTRPVVSPEPQDQARKAKVGNIIANESGHYAVAYSQTGSPKGPITVDLSARENVWVDDRLPQEREAILVWDLREYPRGWRAMKARLYRPEDEK